MVVTIALVVALTLWGTWVVRHPRRPAQEADYARIATLEQELFGIAPPQPKPSLPVVTSTTLDSAITSAEDKAKAAFREKLQQRLTPELYDQLAPSLRIGTPYGENRVMAYAELSYNRQTLALWYGVIGWRLDRYPHRLGSLPLDIPDARLTDDLLLALANYSA